MKKTLLALAVLAAAGSANAAEIVKNDSGTVDFYGQIREAITYETTDNSSETAIDEGSSRAGINASWKLTDSLNLIGNVEFGLTNDMSGRKNWIGVASDEYGSLYFGKNALLADDVYGAEYSWYYGIADKALYDHEVANDDYWQKNSINYDLYKDNFWVRAQYNLDESKSAPTEGALFAGTAFGDLKVHAGVTYYHSNDLTSGNYTGDIESTSTELTGEYTVGDALIGVTYAHIDRNVNDADDDSDAINLATTYNISKATAVYGGYQFVKMQDEDNADLNNVYLGVSYRPVTWALTYVEYGFQDSGVNGTQPEARNGLAVGARVYW